MTFISKIKPAPWAVTPALVAPEWGWFRNNIVWSSVFFDGPNPTLIGPHALETSGASGQSMVGTVGGLALDYTAADGDTELPDTSAVGNPTDLTEASFPFCYECMVVLDANETTIHSIYNNDSNAAGGSSYRGVGMGVRTGANDRFMLSMCDATGTLSSDRRDHFNTTTTIVTDTLYHVIFVMRSMTDVDIWLNGKKEATSTSGTATVIAASFATAKIGVANRRHTGDFEGKILTLTQYASGFELSEAQIYQRFADPFGPFRMFDEARVVYDLAAVAGLPDLTMAPYVPA